MNRLQFISTLLCIPKGVEEVFKRGESSLAKGGVVKGPHLALLDGSKHREHIVPQPVITKTLNNSMITITFGQPLADGQKIMIN